MYHNFPTIQAVIDISVDWDTFLIQERTYVENINFNGRNIVLTSNFIFDQNSLTIEEMVINGNSNE